MQQRNGPATLHSVSEDSCNTTQQKSNISTHAGESLISNPALNRDLQPTSALLKTLET